MIQSNDLIQKFKFALSNFWGYIMGTAGILWTADKQATTENEMAIQYGEKWIGHMVADCSGLFVWAFRQLGGSIYHGSNTIWNKYLTAKGKLTNGQRSDGKPIRPGTAVFLTKGDDRHHIGLYIGNGKCIEAKGTRYGVIESNITHWDEWGELKDVDYMDTPIEPIYKAKVHVDTNPEPVRLRSQPTTKATVIAEIQQGVIVEVLGTVSQNSVDWCYIKDGELTGYMMAKFLVPVTSDDGDTVTISRTDYENAIAALKTALKLLEG